MAHAAHTRDVQGPVRLAGCGRGCGYADVSGVCQRGDVGWDNAHHRRHATAHELRRIVGYNDAAGHRSVAVDLRSSKRLPGDEGPRLPLLEDAHRSSTTSPGFAAVHIAAALACTGFGQYADREDSVLAHYSYRKTGSN